MTLSGETPVRSGLDAMWPWRPAGTRLPSSGSTRRTSRGFTACTRRMLGTHEADEVTQDIFVRTWQKLGQFRGESAFSTWLHRLAVNVVIEQRRSFAIQRERMTDDPAALDLLTVAPARADLTVDFEHGDRAAAAGGARDLRAARRRGLQAPRDCGDARHRDRHVEAAAAPGANADAQTSGWIMTMHEEWTDQLSEYLDGELSADEQPRRRGAPARLRAVHRAC